MLWWLAQNAVMGAVLAVLVALVCRLGRFRPAVRHALWLVVLVKLVAPPVLPWAWPAPQLPLEEPPESATPAEEKAESFLVTSNSGEELSAEDLRAKWLMLAPNGITSESIAPESRHAFAPIVSAPAGTPAAPPVEPAPLPRAAGAWVPGLVAELFLYLWVGAVAAMCGLQLIRTIRFRRLLATGRPALRALRELVADLADQLGVRAPETVIVPGLTTPMVWGLGRPVLLWPASLLGRLSLDCQRAVVVHELAHLRRRDHWVVWLQLLVGCVWWWNPFFRYVNNQVRRNAELACDAWVIQTLPAARRAYAEALLEVSQLTSRSAPPLPALGMAGGHPDFERRLIMIMRDRVPCRVPMLGFALIGLLALVAVPGWSLSQAPADGKPRVKEVEKQTGKKPIEALMDFNGDGFIDVELVQAGKGGPDSDRLDRLEKQLEALLKEVKAMRGTAGKPGNKEVTVEGKPIEKLPPGVQEYIITQGVSGTGIKEAVPAKSWQYSVIQQTDGEHTVTLTRATYKMPKDKAEALAKFLSDQVKGQVLETKVEGEGIVVTTTPHIQRTIHDFVNLVQGGKQAQTFELKGGELELKFGAPPAAK